MTQREVTRELAQYIADLKCEDLPQATIEAAKEAVLDQFGIMLMGSTLPWTRPSYELVQELGGRPESTIVRYGTRTSASEAVFVNANFGHSCEMDDSGYAGGAHSGCLTVPPALALGEREHLSGRDILLGIVVGYEVLSRLGRVIGDAVADRGFHRFSVLGPFGSAAVAGKLLGLDAEHMVHALSIAGSHASGTMEYDQSGGEVKRFHASIAARGGMVAALLAQRGLTGPDTILEGPRGICRLFANVEDAEPIVAGLGDGDWYAVQGRSVKTFPTVHTLHTSMQALGRLMEEHQLRPEQVDEIHVWVTKMTLLHGGTILEPTDTLSSQFSVAFSLGLRLVKGRNELRDYLDSDLWHDPRILEIGRKVRLHADPTKEGKLRMGVRMQVKLKDGRVLETEELHPKGSLENPVSREELREKFRSLASAVLEEEGMQRLIGAVERLEEIEDISQLVPLLVRN